jgi:putative heme iron utilization protein
VDVAFIDKIGDNKKQIHEKVLEWGNALVVTQLVVLWIQKHFPSK